MRYSECINTKPPGKHCLCHSHPGGVLGDKPCWWHNSGAHSLLQKMILAISISKIKQSGLPEMWGGQPACLALSHGVVLGIAVLDLGQPGTAPRESCRRQGPSVLPAAAQG